VQMLNGDRDAILALKAEAKALLRLDSPKSHQQDWGGYQQ